MYHGIGAMRGYVTVEQDGKVVTNITVQPEEAQALSAYLLSLK
jgi:hypothetical protein